MFDLLFSEPCLLIYAFLAGMCFKHLILDKLRAYVIAKVTPGIVKNYLEDALGMNQDVLPAVKVIAVPAPVAPVAAVVAAPAVVAPVIAPVAPVEVAPVAVVQVAPVVAVEAPAVA